ncbi:hypothetical protein YA0850_32715 [Pseudomonas veronii]|jgi:hypothetical protein|uniref:Uncharacterized protein n=1 Tax=Pseudomonas veronii TaxID=76761 RepID=A0ABS0VK92_PSEVE|nr:hypothetical protein [Pseudomonas veronii]MBI6557106.1 hypothetical protein [Pseudomonas veronii]MBI6651948.1 hypothetical protein [Pseudomonas veronii]
MDSLKNFIGDIFSNEWVWVGLLAIGLVMIRSHEETRLSSTIDPFNGVLVVDAPGCEITGPDGDSLKDDIRGKVQVIIPKGSTLNSDCFPAAKAGRASESK